MFNNSSTEINFGNYNELPFKELSFCRKPIRITDIDFLGFKNELENDISISVVKYHKDSLYSISLRVYSTEKVHKDSKDYDLSDLSLLNKYYAARKFDEVNGRCNSKIDDKEMILVSLNKYSDLSAAVREIELFMMQSNSNKSIKDAIFVFFEKSFIYMWSPVLPYYDINQSSLLTLKHAKEVKKIPDSFNLKTLSEVDESQPEGCLLYDVRIGIGISNKNMYHVICEPQNDIEGSLTIDNEMVHFYEFTIEKLRHP